jgi:hypothetical protein
VFFVRRRVRLALGVGEKRRALALILRGRSDRGAFLSVSFLCANKES